MVVVVVRGDGIPCWGAALYGGDAVSVKESERYRKALGDLEEAVYEFYVAGADDDDAHKVVDRLAQDYVDDHGEVVGERFG